MDFEAKLIHNGTVTTPKGFTAGAVISGIKEGGRLDLGILYSEALCVAAGVFTTNKIKAAPVVLSQKSLSNGKAQAMVVNAGCANACTDSQGDKDAAEMAALAAKKGKICSTLFSLQSVVTIIFNVLFNPLSSEPILSSLPFFVRDAG